MRARRTAAELEARAARAAPPGAAPPPLSEPLAMLQRRGLDPRPSRPDLPFPPGFDPAAVAALVDRLRHYAFRLFLRGAILRGAGFTPGQATRYVVPEKAREMADALVAIGLAAPLPRGRYRLVHRPRTFGGTLEWWLGEELRERLALQVATGVRSGAPGVGGDLDVVAAGEGKLLYLEVKSSPPKHVTQAEVGAFLRRVAAVRPDVALFVVDTALRLGDKIVPMFELALARGGGAGPVRRLFRETWSVGPHVYVVNAREDLVDNVCRAIAEGIRALAPQAP
ncbi:hypothetical protein [Anaeromyxobacter terrae]|uniref:hypothetical protein n=1 Tax=Anaeromyxobacter terrae TaxID=2925406 RepID=UPI001F5663F5|nr:hypothetical protein [Anaeromyxobacter sp. SG22]